MKLRSMLGMVMAMAMSATGAAAAPAPIWERFPHLVCRPESQVACAKDVCTTTPMVGMWDVNFSKGLITYLTSGRTETIVGRQQSVAPGVAASMDAMLLSSARMMVFMNWGNDQGRELDAQVVAAIGPNTRTIYLTCAVPK